MAAPSLTGDAPEPFWIAATRALLVLTAVVGCLVPWERLEVRPPGGASTTPLDALHGWGILACAGAVLGLLTLADRALRPSPSLLRDAAAGLAGAGLVAGAALFQSGGGYPVGSSAGGQSTVALGPGLPIAGAAGLLLAAVSLARVWLRRGGSRSPASGGAP